MREDENDEERLQIPEVEWSKVVLTYIVLFALAAVIVWWISLT